MRNVREKKEIGVTECLEKAGKVDRLDDAEQALTIAAAEIRCYSEQWICF
jgi:hypothetical protein